MANIYKYYPEGSVNFFLDEDATYPFTVTSTTDSGRKHPATSIYAINKTTDLMAFRVYATNGNYTKKLIASQNGAIYLPITAINKIDMDAVDPVAATIDLTVADNALTITQGTKTLSFDATTTNWDTTLGLSAGDKFVIRTGTTSNNDITLTVASISTTDLVVEEDTLTDEGPITTGTLSIELGQVNESSSYEFWVYKDAELAFLGENPTL